MVEERHERRGDGPGKQAPKAAHLRPPPVSGKSSSMDPEIRASVLVVVPGIDDGVELPPPLRQRHEATLNIVIYWLLVQVLPKSRDASGHQSYDGLMANSIESLS
jgi:hypothetical protein